MARIHGTLNNASGVRPNTKIVLEAAKTTNDVVIYAPDQTITTDASGNYDFECKPSFYNVTIIQQGFPREKVGIIQVYSDSADGSLNEFLTTFKPDDLTPQILKDCIAARDAAISAADRAEKAADTAAEETAQKVGLMFPVNSGNWSTVAGTQLTESDRYKAWDYPDDSGDRYAVRGNVTLPIAIPAAPDERFYLASAVNVEKMRSESVIKIGTFDLNKINELEVGMTFQTNCYENIFDGGQGLYVISDIESGFTIEISTSKFARLISTPYFASLGIKEGKVNESSNKSIIEKMYAKVRNEGLGVIYIGRGEFYFGDLSIPVTPSSLNTAQGFKGEGVENSKIYVNTSRKVIESGSNFKGFTLLDLTIENENEKTGIGVSLVGGSNLQVKRVNCNNFKKGFVFQVFLAEIENITANNCWLGSQWQGGTTINASTVYAHSCEYGHCFGGNLEDDITVSYRQLLNYNNFKNFAADSCTKSFYVFGFGASNTIDTLGAEVFPALSSASMFLFPPVTGSPDDDYKYRRDNGYKIKNAFGWRLPRGSVIFDIQRECIQTELDGLTLSDSVVDNIDSFYKFTNVNPSSDDIQLKLSNIDGVNLGVASPSISYDGVYYGGFISKYKYGAFSDAYNPSQIFVRKNILTSVTSVNGVRVILQGDKIISNTDLNINITVGSAGYSILGQATIGTLVVASTGDSTGCDYVSVFNGTNDSSLSTTKSVIDGFTYIDITIAGSNIAHRFEIDMQTSASTTSGELLKYVIAL